MPTATAPTTDPTVPTGAAESVFERILADIVRGTHPPGARLPAERELARTLGASRPTLREALRRLSEWQLVEARRGSGIVVRDRREWSIEVLPAYLRYARPGPGEPTIPRLLDDLLTLRRAMLCDMVRVVARRIPPGGTARARALTEHAWSLRGDSRAFIETDFEVMRAVTEAADFLPAMWSLNRLAGVYMDIARTLSGTFRLPEDYLESYTAVMSALEDNDGDRASSVLDEYLERHDRLMMAPLMGG